MAKSQSAANASLDQLLHYTKDKFDEAVDYYDWLMSFADPRTKGWAFVDSPMPGLMCVAGYLLFVLIAPKLMERQKAMKLTFIIIPYNLSMAMLNCYISATTAWAAFNLRYNLLCQPIEISYHPEEIQLCVCVWLFYLSKIIEFMDTFLIILRKKKEQLSFLHIYHHSTMATMVWIAPKFLPTGSVFIPVMGNCAIHTLMYTYYGLSALGPKVAKYLWWKKYLTLIQLAQFAIGVILCVNGLATGCEYPSWLPRLITVYMITFIILFGNFYINVYKEKGAAMLYVNLSGCGPNAPMTLKQDKEKPKES